MVDFLPAGELERRIRDGTLAELPGIGKVTAEVITQATAGRQPDYLARLLGRGTPVAAHRAAGGAARRLPYPLGLVGMVYF